MFGLCSLFVCTFVQRSVLNFENTVHVSAQNLYEHIYKNKLYTVVNIFFYLALYHTNLRLCAVPKTICILPPTAVHNCFFGNKKYIFLLFKFLSVKKFKNFKEGFTKSFFLKCDRKKQNLNFFKFYVGP